MNFKPDKKTILIIAIALFIGLYIYCEVANLGKKDVSLKVFNYETGKEFLQNNPQMEEYSKKLLDQTIDRPCLNSKEDICTNLQKLDIKDVEKVNNEIRYTLYHQAYMADSVGLELVYNKEVNAVDLSIRGDVKTVVKCPAISEVPTSAYTFNSCVIKLDDHFYLFYSMNPY